MLSTSYGAAWKFALHFYIWQHSHHIFIDYIFQYLVPTMAFRIFDRQSLFCFTTTVSCLFWSSITQGASISSSITFQQKAISPTCTTNAAGSSSCNVGINSVSVSYASLDGGYREFPIPKNYSVSTCPQFFYHTSDLGFNSR